MRILIGDDDAELRNSLERALRKYETDSAETPEQAIEKIKTEKYEILITDLQYTESGREGYEVLRQAIPYINVRILFSGLGSEKSVIEKAKEAGATHIVSKTNSSKLLQIIHSYE